MNIIIIAVDLGHFRTHRVIQDDPLGSPRIETVSSYDINEGLSKLSERLSDNAGRFERAGIEGEAARGYGEPHDLEREMRNRVIKRIAKDINAFINRDSCEKWHFAADEQINRHIVKLLAPGVKKKLDKTVNADLTKLKKGEILERFIKNK